MFLVSDAVIKAKPAATDFMEVGSSGLQQNGGMIRDDFLRQMQGKQGYANLREMADNDPVVGAVLSAVELIIRSVEWTVDAADANNQQATDAAEFVSSCLNDMNMSWPDTLSTICTYLTYGFSLHEIVYKRRNGFTNDPKTRSKYNDNRIGWRKLPIRSQDTIQRWDLDETGGIKGAYQMDPYAPKKGLTYLPMEKCLLFRTTVKANNPQGRSILRNAFVSWYYKRRIQEIEAIGIERELAGLPDMQVPWNILAAKTDTLTIPWRPVVAKAILYAMDERGSEFSGRTEFVARRADQLLANAILADSGSEGYTVSEL